MTRNKKKSIKITKYLGASKYKYVTMVEYCGAVMWNARMYHGTGNCKLYKTEKQAAMAVDMSLIKQGKEPVNILKRVANNNK